ncbi:hypothetical protein WA026_002688 [Henosepilachna vigintioctopunctata]|uniref:CUB domain-containing protein n=1 Tax=Henosepilachna vigintioctopunctata TaxID=420089 RepID=A0AAW1U0X6_9CUCU
MYSLPGITWKTKQTRKSRPQTFGDSSEKWENFEENYNSNQRIPITEPAISPMMESHNAGDRWRNSENPTGYNFWKDRKNNFPKYSRDFKWKTIFNSEADRQSMELGSEYGDVVSPGDYKQERFEPVKIPHLTPAPKAKLSTSPSVLSHVQKISKNEAINLNRRNINNLLKRYMDRLYKKKYQSPRYVEIDPNDIDGEKSKIFGGGLETLVLLKNKTKNFANKFLNVFQVIKFNNSACQGTINNLNYQGTCYLASQCSSLNGMAAGSCADGYGVCCIFRGSCGGSQSQNCTFFESPNYPNFYPADGGVVPPTPTPVPTSSPTTQDLRPDPRLPHEIIGRQMNTLDCTFSVSKTSSDIQQMRIDFLDLELLGPTNGTCVNERLVIAGNGINTQVPVICGYNTGQHVYVDVSTLRGPLMLSVLSNMSYRKRFRLRICQYSQAMCMTPNNCLQYYTGTSGVISSFNYDQALMLSRSTPSYFNNLNYAICIRREAGYCSITYTNVMNGLEYPFQFVNFAANGQPTVMPGQAGIETFDCPNDYIVINGVRLCGYKLNDGTVNQDLTMNAPVTDNSMGPIVIQVRTNENAVGRGFKLFYTQNRCPNNF